MAPATSSRYPLSKNAWQSPPPFSLGSSSTQMPRHQRASWQVPKGHLPHPQLRHARPNRTGAPCYTRRFSDRPSESGEHARNRLLGCLALTDPTTDKARRLLAHLQAANEVPTNEPPVRFESWTGKPFGEEEYLAEQGVVVDAEANQKIRRLEQPVKAFTDQQRNATPTLEDVTAVLPAVQTLWMALARADAEGVHPQQRDYAWDCLAAACERIARLDGLSCEDEAGALARTVLLEAVVKPYQRSAEGLAK